MKVEANSVFRGAVYSPGWDSLYQTAVDLFERQVWVNRLSTPDLYGGKLCAALDRQHPRDLFDVKLLLENEGLTEPISKAFIVYLISHNRPMAELLDPNLKDFEPTFEREFRGMTFQPVTYDELVEARTRLITQIHEDLTGDERRFILSVKMGEPDWPLLGIEGIDRLPGVQWKLQNIQMLDRTKHAEAVDRLRGCLGL